MWMSVLQYGSAATAGKDYFILGECLQPSFLKNGSKATYTATSTYVAK